VTQGARPARERKSAALWPRIKTPNKPELSLNKAQPPSRAPWAPLRRRSAAGA
jgi:hypothetical protein